MLRRLVIERSNLLSLLTPKKTFVNRELKQVYPLFKAVNTCTYATNIPGKATRLVEDAINTNKDSKTQKIKLELRDLFDPNKIVIYYELLLYIFLFYLLNQYFF